MRETAATAPNVFKAGDKLQVEVDYIAKLVARQLEFMKSRA